MAYIHLKDITCCQTSKPWPILVPYEKKNIFLDMKNIFLDMAKWKSISSLVCKPRKLFGVLGPRGQELGEIWINTPWTEP